MKKSDMSANSYGQTNQQFNSFSESHIIENLRHYLPAQAPLKDFVHHNTLHAFQSLPFFKAIQKAKAVFGYKSSLSLKEYRSLYKENIIGAKILEHIVASQVEESNRKSTLDDLLNFKGQDYADFRVGSLRSNWKSNYKIDLDSVVHPTLFKLLNSFLDQGVAVWANPVAHFSFIEGMREMESKSFCTMLSSKRAKSLLLDKDVTITKLLELLVGEPALYEHYLFDQQFAHPGWSGMVATIESSPETLLDHRQISLEELIRIELILEIDVLDSKFGSAKWQPLCKSVDPNNFSHLFKDNSETREDFLISIWQKAFELSYHDQVLFGISESNKRSRLNRSGDSKEKKFQALFCIDDRECSIRRHIERVEPSCQTFGTPGFFGGDFFYQPQGGNFYTKVCPGPINPKHLIKEFDVNKKREKDVHFNKLSHRLLSGWLVTQSIGLWSAIKLFVSIFKPSFSPSTSSAFAHVDEFSTLTIERDNDAENENGLQIGYTIEEMATRVDAVLRSIGLIDNFAPLVYVMGHGSTSTNNTHYAGYDCGACSGRPGSVNARVFSHMANHKEVRKILAESGLHIPDKTTFIGGLHDTSRDEFTYYFGKDAAEEITQEHKKNVKVFTDALNINVKERARRFELQRLDIDDEKLHEQVKLRSISLFEPRPELNHATNTLCIVGRTALTKGLFLDRRAFLNTYNPLLDLDGKYLAGILNAATPVCGGINLEYYFSRVDKEKLGAGSKLPHNVMGLIGVANGIEGDLRTGLPFQMTELHDPLRLMMIVEQYPDVLLKVIQSNDSTYEWYINEWVLLVAIHPETGQEYTFVNGAFEPYRPIQQKIDFVEDVEKMVVSSANNLSVVITN